MAITDDDLREIFTNAPVVKDTFEVITISASWFSQDYHLQNVFTDGIDVELSSGNTVTADYAPMSLGQSNSNADLIYERSIVIQGVNDIIASEIASRSPTTSELPKVSSNMFIMYRDGTVSESRAVINTTEISSISRDEIGTTIVSSTKPVNAQATGELATTTRVPMLKGFL